MMDEDIFLTNYSAWIKVYVNPKGMIGVLIVTSKEGKEVLDRAGCKYNIREEKKV